MTGVEIGELIVSLIDVVAWPLVAVGGVVMLWRLLPRIIPYIESVSGRGWRVNLRPTVEELTMRARSLGSADDEDASPIRPLEVVAEPRMTIMMAWASVERAIAELAGVPGARTSTRRQIDTLFRRGAIDGQLAAVLRDMHAVRNLIAHSTDVQQPQDLDERTVRIYVEAAARLQRLVEHYQETDDPI